MAAGSRAACASRTRPRPPSANAHALTLGTLWRQHFGYGRGARCFHRARSAPGADPFRPEGDFYLKPLRASLPRARREGAPAPHALPLRAQLANAAGFFYEHFQFRIDQTGGRRASAP